MFIFAKCMKRILILGFFGMIIHNNLIIVSKIQLPYLHVRCVHMRTVKLKAYTNA